MLEPNKNLFSVYLFIFRGSLAWKWIVNKLATVYLFVFSFAQAEKYVKVNQVFKKLDKYNSEYS